MIEYNTKIKEIEVKEVVKIKCDKCKTEFDINDDYELQEFHHINFEGGYGSIFGDGYVIKADICQNCLFNMIKNFMRVE